MYFFLNDTNYKLQTIKILIYNKIYSKRLKIIINKNFYFAMHKLFHSEKLL